ncbi:MAG: alpha/beta hydrolase [Clostridia bacterium]|nr:alpha/beta hydrolase [Clostridia bacterium]
MKNYFIIHGTYGHNKENWFPWLENKLKEQGYEVFNFNYPTPEGHNFENWSKVLDKVKDKINNESVFVCHSIGCVFLAKYCLSNNIRIGKCIFVSGCNNYYFLEDFDKINKFMYTDEINKFINLCNERICIYSKDDPYIKIDALESFAQSINAKKIIYEKAGHFNEKAGYTEFEDLLKLL